MQTLGELPWVWQSRRRSGGELASLRWRWVPDFHFTRGLVLSSSPHWWALYFFTSAIYLVQASPLPPSSSGSTLCFLATIPVLRVNLAPPLRFPTWVRGEDWNRYTSHCRRTATDGDYVTASTVNNCLQPTPAGIYNWVVCCNTSWRGRYLHGALTTYHCLILGGHRCTPSWRWL